MQVYIVTGGADGQGSQWGPLATAETMLKDGGTSWGMVTSLPSARTTLRGISLPNGRFMVTGGIHYPEGTHLNIHEHFRRLLW